ncbi:MAG: hypothetical protein ABJA87_08145 [bacterium]
MELTPIFAKARDPQQPLAAQRGLSPLTTRAGIPTCVVESPGGHDFDLWTRALQQSLPWLANWVGGGPPPPATVADGGTCTSS